MKTGNQHNYGQLIKSIAKIAGYDVLPNIKMPRNKSNTKIVHKHRMPQKQPERALELAILRHLDLRGVIVGKTKIKGVALPNGGWGYDKWNFRGFADLHAFKDGVMYAIEVKAGKNKLEENQIRYRDLFHNPPSRIFIEAYKLEDVYCITKEKEMFNESK